MRIVRLGIAANLSIAAVALLPLLTVQRAAAEEPVTLSEPRLLRETAEVTSVVDAFDKDDPFDLHLSLGFQQTWKHANIRRETSLFAPGLSTGGYVARTENIAKYSQSLSLLNVEANVGLYKDLAFVLRLPIILSDSRELEDLDGSTRNPERLRDPTGSPLFTVPHQSPTRSGIDYFAAGFQWAPTNQQRDSAMPTWLLGVMGRFGVGTPLHPCTRGAAVECPDPANPAFNREPGISRAMWGVEAQTVISRRFGYIEPYTGFSFLYEWSQGRGDYGATNNAKGALLDQPPPQLSFTAGVEVIPFERREQFQRLVADFRVRGTYVFPGREYSELFDALGSSQAPTLRAPNPGAYTRSPTGTGSVADPRAPNVYFAGLTDQQGYGTVGGSTSFTWQAGEYVKLQLGFGLRYAQSHLVTAADACNPSFKGDADVAGPCHATGATTATGGEPVTGIPNPNHRPVVDAPGRRFSVDDSTIMDLWISGIVMF